MVYIVNSNIRKLKKKWWKFILNPAQCGYLFLKFTYKGNNCEMYHWYHSYQCLHTWHFLNINSIVNSIGQTIDQRCYYYCSKIQIYKVNGISPFEIQVITPILLIWFGAAGQHLHATSFDFKEIVSAFQLGITNRAYLMVWNNSISLMIDNFSCYSPFYTKISCLIPWLWYKHWPNYFIYLHWYYACQVILKMPPLEWLCSCSLLLFFISLPVCSSNKQLVHLAMFSVADIVAWSGMWHLFGEKYFCGIESEKCTKNVLAHHISFEAGDYY